MDLGRQRVEIGVHKKFPVTQYAQLFKRLEEEHRVAHQAGEQPGGARKSIGLSRANQLSRRLQLEERKLRIQFARGQGRGGIGSVEALIVMERPEDELRQLVVAR